MSTCNNEFIMTYLQINNQIVVCMPHDGPRGGLVSSFFAPAKGSHYVFGAGVGAGVGAGTGRTGGMAVTGEPISLRDR